MATESECSEGAEPVDLYIYDLTQGLAALLSPAIMGRQVEGVWHTSLVVFGREYYYGGGGIASAPIGGTMAGQPREIQRLGVTYVPAAVFREYLQGLAATTFAGSAYTLLEHNCNHFTDEVAQFLCGARIPKHIVQQPETDLPPPFRAALESLLRAPDGGQSINGGGVRYDRQDSPDYLTLNTQIEEARAQSTVLEQRRTALADKLARKERRREKKRRKMGGGDLSVEQDMAEAVEAPPQEELRARAGPSSEPEEDERGAAELRRRAKDPPITFKDIDGAAEFAKLQAAVGNLTLTPEEHQSLSELEQYLVQGEGSWALGDEFLAFIGRLLNADSSEEIRVATLRCLAAMALRDDVSLLLHQDRRSHAVMNYARRIDQLPPAEQSALALALCNLFENISSSEWLLYISEWEVDGQPVSNIRVTTKVAVHATLSEDATLRDIGTALMYNMATKEVKTVVFDDVSVELAMALLQLLAGAPGEELLFRAVAALARLAHHSSEVGQLVAMVGPPPDNYRGMSPRCDEKIDLIMQKVK
ncbi:uncharacterized protein LOC125233129 [Leguminivora glycinivorella]|uniref:uncharacterized protein LOC125233129 n=1 Tax=Leguminivora glycinivorella TaxID=1035111 RepID=UPI00200D55D3|nr:uncharacterized protein LOC125233129 [Leguminivora glycinivorella]